MSCVSCVPLSCVGCIHDREQLLLHRGAQVQRVRCAHVLHGVLELRVARGGDELEGLDLGVNLAVDLNKGAEDRLAHLVVHVQKLDLWVCGRGTLGWVNDVIGSFL